MDEKTFYMLVGFNIKIYRHIYNATIGDMKQKDLAKKAGVSTATIGALESNNINHGVSMYNLYKIAKALEVPIDKFFVD